MRNYSLRDSIDKAMAISREENRKKKRKKAIDTAIDEAQLRAILRRLSGRTKKYKSKLQEMDDYISGNTA